MCLDCVVTGKYIWENYDVGFPNLITYRGNKMLGGIGMKNREKYKNELMDVIKEDGRLCGFVKKHGLFRMIETNWENLAAISKVCRTRANIN